MELSRILKGSSSAVRSGWTTERMVLGPKYRTARSMVGSWKRTGFHFAIFQEQIREANPFHSETSAVVLRANYAKFKTRRYSI